MQIRGDLGGPAQWQMVVRADTNSNPTAQTYGKQYDATAPFSSGLVDVEVEFTTDYTAGGKSYAIAKVGGVTVGETIKPLGLNHSGHPANNNQNPKVNLTVGVYTNGPVGSNHREIVFKEIALYSEGP